jgi:hypothetical protein
MEFFLKILVFERWSFNKLGLSFEKSGPWPSRSVNEILRNVNPASSYFPSAPYWQK